MKKEYPWFMKCLDLAAIVSFGLIIILDVFEVEIHLRNIAGGTFLISLFVCSGISLICPQYQSVVVKVLFGRWYRR